jgi:hypothetical protein
MTLMRIRETCEVSDCAGDCLRLHSPCGALPRSTKRRPLFCCTQHSSAALSVPFSESPLIQIASKQYVRPNPLPPPRFRVAFTTTTSPFSFYAFCTRFLVVSHCFVHFLLHQSCFIGVVIVVVVDGSERTANLSPASSHTKLHASITLTNLRSKSSPRCRRTYVV